MLGLIALTLALAVSIQGRTFNNPILGDADYPDPGAIKVDGTYYIVSSTYNNQTQKCPIHKSTDLINWNKVGYVFNETNLPTWTYNEQKFWAPEIHKIGNNYQIYFSAVHNTYYASKIGVAIASHPEGPYRPTNEALIEAERSVEQPTIINNDGTLYLLFISEGSIRAHELSSDGLSIVSNQSTELIQTNLKWEGVSVTAPWHIQHGDYHYIFYTGNYFCELYKIGVARSRNLLGPYEKHGDPILDRHDDLIGPAHNSIVKDLDNNSDVIIFHYYPRTSICTSRVTGIASMDWGNDDWPNVLWPITRNEQNKTNTFVYKKKINRNRLPNGNKY